MCIRDSQSPARLARSAKRRLTQTPNAASIAASGRHAPARTALGAAQATAAASDGGRRGSTSGRCAARGSGYICRMVSALYPGSFDPVTRGHIDLVERALPLFDHLTVAVGVNTQKNPTFSTEERVEMLREVLPSSDKLDVVTFTGLVVDYCRERGIGAILRGVRTISDLSLIHI